MITRGEANKDFVKIRQVAEDQWWYCGHEFQRAGRPDLGVQQILQVFDFALFEHPKPVSL